MDSSGFKADHRGVKTFGTWISSLYDDAEEARTYAARHLSLGEAAPGNLGDRGGHMFLRVKETAEQVLDALLANYVHLARIALESGAEVQRAADYYRRTDQRSAKRIDATYGR
jgi:hypothetical protein